MNTELRISAGAEVRMVDGDDGKPSMIVGYAAIYNSLSQDLGGFREMVRPGAFTDVLKESPDVRGRYNHEAILGRSKSGTLRLFDDSKGLRYEIDMPNTTTARDLAESIKRGDVDGSSFAFQVRGSDGENWRKDNGHPVRELRRLSLFDVGPVDSPAYLGTEGNVGLRSLPAASQRAAAAIVTIGTPNLYRAKLKLAQMAEHRFYVDSPAAADACIDALRQAASTCDSVMSVSWKVEGMDVVASACSDCMSVCSAASQILGNDDSEIGADVCALASKALATCATACEAFDHATTKLCALVCRQAAGQCDALAPAFSEQLS